MDSQYKSSLRSAGEKVTSLYVVFMLSFFLLLVSPAGYSRITEFKFAVFLYLSGGLILCLFFIFVLGAVFGDSQKSHGFCKAAAVARVSSLLLLAVSALSFLFSEFRSDALFGAFRYEGLVTCSLYILIFLSVSKFGRRKKIYVYIFGAAMTAFCAISILQFMGYNPFSLYPRDLDYMGHDVLYPGKYFGTIGNAGLCAAVLSIAIPVFFVSAVKIKSRLSSILFVPLILSVFVLSAAEVDAGLVALAVFLILAPFLCLKSREDAPGFFLACSASLAALVLGPQMVGGGNMPEIMAAALSFFSVFSLALFAVFSAFPDFFKDIRRLKKILAVFFIALILAFFILLFFFGEGFEGALGELSQVLHGKIDDSFGSGRVYIWRETLHLISEKPLLGGGPDTLGLRGIEPMVWASPAGGEPVFAHVTAAHNEYLNIAADRGIPALVLFLTMLVSCFVSAFRRIDDCGVLICLCASISFCVQAFFGISMCASNAFFYIMIGLMCAPPYKDENELR